MLILIHSILTYIICILTIVFTNETLCVKEVPKKKKKQKEKEKKNKAITYFLFSATILFLVPSFYNFLDLLITRKSNENTIVVIIGLNFLSFIFSTITAYQGTENSDNCEENEKIKTKVDVMKYISFVSIFITIIYMILFIKDK